MFDIRIPPDLATDRLDSHKVRAGTVVLMLADLCVFTVALLAHLSKYPLLHSAVFATSLAVMTHLLIWRGIGVYNKDDVATIALDPLFLQFVVYFLYLGISAIPPLLESSYLERALQGTDGFYLGMPLAMGGMLATYVGCSAAGFKGIRGRTMSRIRTNVCAFAVRRHIRLLFVLLTLDAVLWALRFYQISTGYYSNYTHADETLVSGWMSVAIYLPYTLQYFVIPLVALVYVGARNGFVTLLMLVILALEAFNGFAVSHRTLILTLAVQAVGAFALLRKTSVMKVVTAGALALLFFFVVVQPAVFAYRVVVRSIGLTGDDYAEAFWGELWTDTAESISSGEAEKVTEDWAKRDIGYRLAAQGYLSALAKAVILDGRDPPYGEFTLRNAASIVPSIFWPEKREYSIAFMKLEMPMYYRIPPTDYNQTLTAHFFADGGTAGLLLGMLCFGVYIGMIARVFLIGMRRSPVRFIMIVALVPVLFFRGVGDFRNFFIGPWRECFMIYLLISLVLKSAWNGRGAVARQGE